MPKSKEKVQSMEEYGPISTDIFMGRQVIRVDDLSDKPVDVVWSIIFEGDGMIHNYDPSLKAPKVIVGAALTMQILGAHKSEFDRTPLTILRFGLEQVEINPLQYAIYDPQLTKGILVFPQRSHANMIPPHPDERVADGPTGPED